MIRKIEWFKTEWFKIVVSLFMVGILYIGFEYVQTQKEMSENGRYQVSSASFGYEAIDTRTGVVYITNTTNEIPK